MYSLVVKLISTTYLSILYCLTIIGLVVVIPDNWSVTTSEHLFLMFSLISTISQFRSLLVKLARSCRGINIDYSLPDQLNTSKNVSNSVSCHKYFRLSILIQNKSFSERLSFSSRFCSSCSKHATVLT